MGTGPGRIRRRARSAVTVAVAAAFAVIGSLVTGGAAAPAAEPAPSAGDGDVTPMHASTFQLADPDTVHTGTGGFVTYGTTVPAGRGERCSGAPTGQLYVPVLRHGSGNTVGFTNCASGDALPDGPGAWAEPGGAIWAPGVTRLGDRYFMFYTASRKGSGQKCIGRAIASSAYGPFRSAGEWACPSGGRWALDANPFISGGNLYVTYRDDAIASGAETGISTVRTDSEGRAIWDTRRNMLLSTDISWDTRGTSGGTHVVENPSMWRRANGTWYLMWSGNNWDSARYATGIAECGTTPLPSSRCQPLRGTDRPYFGYTGSGGLGPYRGLPSNRQGPGGMDVFTVPDGSLRVVWHWWNNGPRYPMNGALLLNADGYYVQ